MAARYAHALLDCLRAEGVQPSLVLPPAQLAAVEGAGDEPALPVSGWLELLEQAARATGDPNLGLKVGDSFTIKHLGLVGYVLMTCGTLGEAVAQANRYLQLIGGVGGTRIERRGDRAELVFEWKPGAPPPLSEAIFTAATATLSRWLAGRPDLRFAACYRCERPADVSEYQRIFGGELRFGGSDTKLVFPAEYLELPIALANPEIHEVMVARADAVLEQASGEPPLLGAVKRAIAGELAAGRASLASVARALNLSTRTLHRRLEEHGLSFREVIGEVRRRRAESCLRDPSISLAETAFLLGYSEQSTFQHAFKRWAGMTPGEFRASALPR